MGIDWMGMMTFYENIPNVLLRRGRWRIHHHVVWIGRGIGRRIWRERIVRRKRGMWWIKWGICILIWRRHIWNTTVGGKSKSGNVWLWFGDSRNRTPVSGKRHLAPMKSPIKAQPVQHHTRLPDTGEADKDRGRVSLVFLAPRLPRRLHLTLVLVLDFLG